MKSVPLLQLAFAVSLLWTGGHAQHTDGDVSTASTEISTNGIPSTSDSPVTTVTSNDNVTTVATQTNEPMQTANDALGSNNTIITPGVNSKTELPDVNTTSQEIVIHNTDTPDQTSNSTDSSTIIFTGETGQIPKPTLVSAEPTPGPASYDPETNETSVIITMPSLVTSYDPEPNASSTLVRSESTPSPSSSGSNNTYIIHETHDLKLTFNGTCNQQHNAESTVENQIHNLMGSDHSQVNISTCQNTVSMMVVIQNLTEVSHFESLIGKFQLVLDSSNFTLVQVELMNLSSSNGSDMGFIPRLFAGFDFSSPEIITYAVVGAVFGAAIIIIIILLCCKCCSRNRRKPIDDIPHLTMRLEDYSLTRIPRPNTVFNDGRGAPYTNGVDRPSQSFDTSVVPIEEGSECDTRHDLQSFNARRHRHRRVELDNPDLYSAGGSVLAGSTERLARDFENQRSRRGAENQNFRF